MTRRKKVTANDLLARLEKKARPGVSWSQLADVLLDAFVEYATIPPDCTKQVLWLAEERLRSLQWSASPVSRSPNGERE